MSVSQRAVEALIPDNVQEFIEEVVAIPVDTLVPSELIPESWNSQLRDNPPLISVAACVGAHRCFSMLLVLGADIDLQDARQRTPMHFAAAGDDVRIIAALVDCGGLIEATDVAGWTPLFYAAAEGHLLAVRALVHAGARVQVYSLQNTTPRYYASISGFRDVESFLLERGALDTDAEHRAVLKRLDAEEEANRHAVVRAVASRPEIARPVPRPYRRGPAG